MDNASRRLQVPTSPLSDAGEQQARLLAQRLASEPIANIVCSDYQRARHTAQLIHEALKTPIAPPVIETGLRERNFGDLRGQRYADASNALFDEDFAPPGGETWMQFDRRIAKTWQMLMNAISPNESAHTLLVTHGLVCRSIVRQFGQTHQPVPDVWHNTSMTVLSRFEPHRISVLNDASHLSALTHAAQV